MAKAALARVEYDLHQTNKKGLLQIERLEGQVITEVQERIRVEGEMLLERRDMSIKIRETDKQTRQLSIDRAQLGLERIRYVAHIDKLAFDKKAMLQREKNNNMRMAKAKTAMSVQTNVGIVVWWLAGSCCLFQYLIRSFLCPFRFCWTKLQSLKRQRN